MYSMLNTEDLLYHYNYWNQDSLIYLIKQTHICQWNRMGNPKVAHTTLSNRCWVRKKEKKPLHEDTLLCEKHKSTRGEHSRKIVRIKDWGSHSRSFKILAIRENHKLDFIKM